METRVSVSYTNVINKLIAFHMYLHCLSTLILDTRQIKCDKTSKIFSLNKVLFHIFVSFSLQITLDLLYI